MIDYHYDANYIIGITVKNRSASVLTTDWEKLHDIFSKAGVAPSTWVMDNEILSELNDALTTKDISYHFIPSHSHQKNLKERAIQTFKNHFKAGMASVDPTFPLSE